MQIKKIMFLIAFCLLLCAGCTTKYTLTIKKDGSVEEKLYVSEDQLYFDKFPNSSKGLVISEQLSPYLDELNSKGYTVSPFTGSESGGVTITKKYKSIEEYAENSIIYKQYTKEIKIDKHGDEITFSADGKFSHSEQNQEFFPVYNADIVIDLPFKVKKNNSDDHDESSYLWKFTDKDTKNRTITITYNTKKLANNNDSIIIIVLVILIALLTIGFIIYRRTMAIRNKVNKL